jgi:hypothetical protein
MLTPKQARFVEEYLVDLNAKQAAIRAGYSPKTAEVQGCRLLRNVQVAAAIQRAQAERCEAYRGDRRHGGRRTRKGGLREHARLHAHDRGWRSLPRSFEPSVIG